MTVTHGKSLYLDSGTLTNSRQLVAKHLFHRIPEHSLTIGVQIKHKLFERRLALKNPATGM